MSCNSAPRARQERNLPVPAAVRAASTMRAAPVEPSASRTSALEALAVEASAAGAPTLEAAAVGISAVEVTTTKIVAVKIADMEVAAAEASVISAATKSVPAVVKIAPAKLAAIEAGAAIVTAEPGTGADKDSVGEPIGPVVSVGSAGVRIIVIVAVHATGRRPNVSRAEPDANLYSLRMRVGRCDQSHSQHGDHRKVFHLALLESVQPI